MTSAKLLEQTPAELAAAFLRIQSVDDVAALLNYDCGRLLYWARTTTVIRYTKFDIPKRRGGHRTIAAPNRTIRLIQQRLNQVLQALLRPRACMHGFAKNRSVITNAQPHVGAKVVINVDLNDFFPAIHFGRVHGLFMSSAFRLPHEPAKLLAQICCHDGRLPQGAPTSPVISNLICYSLDRDLTDFARKHGFHYTRYADDITLSSRRRHIPVAVAAPNSVDDKRRWNCGSELTATIEKNGFTVNHSKFRVQYATGHQEVTGLTVRIKPNVLRSYVRGVWSDLHVFRKFERTPERMRSVRGKIEWIGQVRGKADPLYLRLLKYWYDVTQQPPTLVTKRPPSLINNESTLLRLTREFDDIKKMTDRRAAGLLFEQWLSALFAHAGIVLAAPFRVDGEQIDGAFEHRNQHYLLEAKWHTMPLGNAQVYPFFMKVTGKSAYTRGLMVSVSGFSNDIIRALPVGKESRIVLMDSRHILATLSGKFSLATLLDRCIENLVVRGEVLFDPESDDRDA